MELQRVEVDLTLLREKVRKKTLEVKKLVNRAKNTESEGDFATIAVQVQLHEIDIAKMREEMGRLQVEKSEIEMGRTLRSGPGKTALLRSYVDVVKTPSVDEKKAVEMLRSRLEVDSWMLETEKAQTGTDDLQTRFDKLKSGK